MPNQDECKTDNSNIFVVVTIILVAAIVKSKLACIIVCVKESVFLSLIKETMNALTKLLTFIF